MKKVTLALILASITSLVLALSLGSVRIPLSTILNSLSLHSISLYTRGQLSGSPYIILGIRLPRVMLAYLVGFSLALAGTASQALFRNPLADPYILGISGGASIGAAIALAYSPRYVEVFAFVGAIMAVYLVYRISKVNGHIPVDVLLLAGIAVGFFSHAVTSYILYMNRDKVHQGLSWLFGTLALATWSKVFIMAVAVGIGGGMLFLSWRELNLLLLGEESIALGLDVNLYRRLIIFAIAILTGVAVSESGIIGFIGLVSPHIMRMFVGPNHRRLLPVSAMLGGILLVISDLISRTIVSPVEIPVGIVTALFGAPFFAYLLMRRKRGELYA
ncbi:FecCD family ABC transporter permease [Pyrococcus abyssi]|uniref:Iron (III) ABC transporter, permease protein n=1 Tax=Pyrococcus abyssi (strain GE5 / Orsay) TaxID=272844 RepID=Q9UZ79_PYRAB|nr:iron ABC transporter permease [Pyrococcus abyssi]CAB50180.1 hemU iron (III) ABC transporter, permease protein [Pyrococcus abyssi GE5]CCE70713.1 TPA: iron (III) ABC transporter, permease protein [Pyrococcus abyssi GE5]